MNLRHAQLFASVRADHRRGASRQSIDSARDAQSPDRAEKAAPGLAYASTGAAPVASRADGAPAGRRTTDGRQSAALSGPRFELELRPNVQAILLLAARAAGETPGEFVARSIVFRAQEAVGFPALAEELTAVPDFERRNRSRGGGP